MTNAEKFEEIFGFKPDMEIDNCPIPVEVCRAIPSLIHSDCPFYNWWNKEYKPCFRLDMEKVKCTKQ